MMSTVPGCDADALDRDERIAIVGRHGDAARELSRRRNARQLLPVAMSMIDTDWPRLFVPMSSRPSCVTARL